MNLLEKILKIEAEISALDIERNKLGELYLSENFPFKKGDKIIVKYNDRQIQGVIIHVRFNSHSLIRGLADVMIKPISRRGTILQNKNAFSISDDGIKQIEYFTTPELLNPSNK